MRLCFIGCEVMVREVAAIAATAAPVIDLHFLPHGLHNVPDELRRRVQAAIDLIERGEDRAHLGGPFGRAAEYECDAILLGYGLCSNGTVGLRSRRFSLVIPRAHDCITLFLGSKERYEAHFAEHPGTYWFTAGWVERSLPPGPERFASARKKYAEAFGEEAAAYLLEVETAWYRRYDRAAYIDWGLPRSADYRACAKACAADLGWEFEELPGDAGLLCAFLNGEWDEERFLLLRPGEAVAPSFDRRILVARAG
ncbi:MAG: DUF1638 domain-containing protein, partial [Firmicutes bacterium]|nr:DUF1638 domain-containing protein [Bacillota bacterium]